MKYFIKIINNNNLIDNIAINEIFLLGFKNVQSIKKSKIYSIIGKISLRDIKFICENLLIDSVVENYQINKVERLKNVSRVNIWYKPMVLDVVAKNVEKGIKYLGINKELEIHSGTQVTIYPNVSKKVINEIINKVFMNELIQYFEIL